MSDHPSGGGQAFPLFRQLPDGHQTHFGMTLRDYFAGQSILAASHYGGGSIEDRARLAYAIADAMILAREGKRAPESLAVDALHKIRQDAAAALEKAQVSP